MVLPFMPPNRQMLPPRMPPIGFPPQGGPLLPPPNGGMRPPMPPQMPGQLPPAMPPQMPGMSPGQPPQLPPTGMPPIDPLDDPMFFRQLVAQMEQMELAEDSQPAEDRRPDPPKKPDEAKLLSAMDKIIDFWRPRDERMDEDERLYQLTEEDTTLNGEVIISNMPYATVEKAANILSSHKATVHSIPSRNDLREEASQLTDFLEWLWDDWDNSYRTSSIQGSLDRTKAHFLGLRGWSTERIGINLEVQPMENPLRMRPFDPRNVYPAFGSNGDMRFVVHRYWTTYGELFEEWEEAEKKFEERDVTEIVEVKAYYDSYYHAVYADSQELKKLTAHEYGFVPWVVGTGYGAPARATVTDQTNWTKNVGVSIFHGAKGLYGKLNRILSQLATEVAKAANPPQIHYYDPQVGKEPQALDLSPGTVNYAFIDRERVEPIKLTSVPSEIGPLMEFIQQEISKVTLPDVLWGLGPGGSGFMNAVNIDSARDQIHPLVEAITHTKQRMSELALKLILNFHDGPIGYFVKDKVSGEWSAGHTVTPGLIEEVGTKVIARFRDIMPKDRMMMAQIASMLTEKKIISIETARQEYVDIDNPERENDRVLADLMYLNEDVVNNVIIPTALAKTDPEMFQMWTMFKEKEQRDKQAEAAGGGGEGGGGLNVPPTAQPPIGQPGANPLMQALGSSIGGAGGSPSGGPPGMGGS